VIENRNVSEIAVSVGYRSEAALNRVFKLKTGQTPAAYRKNKFLK